MFGTQYFWKSGNVDLEMWAPETHIKIEFSNLNPCRAKCRQGLYESKRKDPGPIWGNFKGTFHGLEIYEAAICLPFPLVVQWLLFNRLGAMVAISLLPSILHNFFHKMILTETTF